MKNGTMLVIALLAGIALTWFTKGFGKFTPKA